jgi:N-acetylglucosamine repressor
MRRKSTLTSHLESDIIKKVRASDGISRVELSRALGLAPSTAGIYVERLIKLGFIVQQEKASREAGRPPVLLRLNPEGGCFIGVEFEARNIRAVAVDFADKPQRNAYRAIAEGESAQSVLQKIEDTIEEVMPRDKSLLLAIGAGVPGIIDPVRGLGVAYKYIDRWKNVPLRERLKKRFKVPVFLENSIRSMALAEFWFGQGRGLRHFICFGVRSGIGAGMVLNGSLYRGGNFNAGLVGRWKCSITPSTAAWFGYTRSEAGAVELQEVASVRSIQKAIQKAISLGETTVLKKLKDDISFADVVAAAQQRDALTLRILEEAASAIGQAIGRLNLVVDPSKVIMAGPLTLLGDIFLQLLRNAVHKTVGDAGITEVEVVNSTMGDYGGALGVAALALEEWKPS